MVPELIKTTWIVGQGEGKGWVDASGMRAVSASSQEASAEATNARQTLSRAADVVYLVGATPAGLPRGWEGEYRRQPGGGAHQTRFEYVKAGEAERLLWYSAEMGEWYAARRRARGTPYGRAMLSAYDSALLPELVTAKWHAWRHDDGGDAKGGGKRAEADWVEVPAVSCIAGKLGKETHEAETKAAIGELARGAAAVYLLGTLPRGLHHEWLGRYERRNASSLVNGRFVYANAGFEKKMLWYAGGAWYVGLRGQLGNARGVFSSEDTAELPEQIAKPWRVWEVAPGTTTRAKAGGGEGAWGNAPELRCLAGASGEAAYGSVVAEARRGVAEAAGSVYLIGGLEGGKHHEWLGEYVRRPRAVEAAAADYPDRPVYGKRADATKAIWYKPGNGQWMVGSREGYASDGSGRGVLSSYDDAYAPDRAASGWRVWSGPQVGWAPVPALRCVSGAEGDAWRRAREVGVHRSAAHVFLVGRAPPSVPSEYLGEYERKGVFGGRHLYVRKGGQGKALSYYEPTGEWRIGPTARPVLADLSKDVLSVYDDALRPDNVSAPWKAATGTAKGLRVLSGDVGRLALRAHAAFDALVYALTPGFILPVSPADVRQKLELLLALSFGEELITADVRDRLGTVLGRGEVGKLLAPLPV